jgi:hypothetical protein
MQIDPTNPADKMFDNPSSQPKTITDTQIRKSARGLVPKKQWPVALATPHLNTDGQNDQTNFPKPNSNTSLMQDVLNILYQEPGQLHRSDRIAVCRQMERRNGFRNPISMLE